MTGLEALSYLNTITKLGEQLSDRAKKSLDDEDVEETESYVYAARLSADLAEWLTVYVSDKTNW